MSENYTSKLTRRTTLKWISTMVAGAALSGGMAGCSTADENEVADAAANWPDLKLETITENGYGTDPAVMESTVTWPLTLTSPQLNLIAKLSDIICPADEHGPAASSVGVPEFIDEWVSAPYATQQRDRVTILSGLLWLDQEASRRFKTSFIKSGDAQQIEIIEDIAYAKKKSSKALKPAVNFFATLRGLVLGAYFCSPEGWEDIGYIGNIAIAGDYPGPTEEAMQHLNKVLADLNFEPFSYEPLPE